MASPEASLNHRDGSTWSTVRGAAFKTLFIIGSAALVLDSVRNSLTWHLDRFWGGAGDTWQTMWTTVLSYTGTNMFVLEVIMPYLIGNTVFFGLGLIYAYMDITNKPEWARKYKIQQGTNEPVSMDKFKKLLKCVTFNHGLVTFFALAAGHCLNDWRRKAFRSLVVPEWDVWVLPEFQWVILELGVFVLVEEIAFYYSHRMLHHKSIYKYVHKIHHEWTASVSWTALYSHPVEHVLSNIVPVFLGPFICGSHVATSWLWTAVAIMSTMNAHSGYHFPFFPSPEAHDFHHLKFNQCYGVLGILDYLHGTDTLFRNSVEYKRHIMLLSMTPASEAFPDEESKKKSL